MLLLSVRPFCVECCCLLLLPCVGSKVTEDDLAKYFGLLGEVNNVIMLRDKFTSRHKVSVHSTSTLLLEWAAVKSRSATSPPECICCSLSCMVMGGVSASDRLPLGSSKCFQLPSCHCPMGFPFFVTPRYMCRQSFLERAALTRQRLVAARACILIAMPETRDCFAILYPADRDRHCCPRFSVQVVSPVCRCCSSFLAFGGVSARCINVRYGL